MSRPFPSQAPDLVCLCGHTGRDHCDDGECVAGGVAGDGLSFVCGCTRWRPLECDAEVWIAADGRKIPLAQMEDSHVLNALRLFRAKASAVALSPSVPDNDPLKAAKVEMLQMRERAIYGALEKAEREATRRGLDV